MKNKISYLNRNLISSVIMPYDFVLMVTFLSVMLQNVTNMYVKIVFIVFCMNSVLLNQVNTIISCFPDIFQFKYDLKNIELYQMSGQNLNMIVKAKIKLCFLLTVIPAVITLVTSLCFMMTQVELPVKYIVLGLVVECVIFVVAPFLNLSVYGYLLKMNGNCDDEEFEEKAEDLINKFCNVPRKLIILPMMYLLLANAIMRLITGVYWEKVFCVFVIWCVAIVLVNVQVGKRLLKKEI